MVRHLLVICLAAAATACASTHATKTAHTDPPITPTQQFAVALTHGPDEIRLAPHAGDGPITIQAPAGADAYRGAAAVQTALRRLGLAETQIHLVGYDASTSGSSGIAPIVVGYDRYEAHGPRCGREWKDFTKTGANQPNTNFGCAVTANFAAMIANPADLADPRPIDPADANRRETILGKYRKGEVTSSAKDPQANAAVSSTVQ